MKRLFKAFAVLGLGLTLSMTGISLAEDDASADARKARKELNREHKEQRREMHRQHRAESMLLRVDANKDGNVDLNEYLAHAQERFNKLDTNSDGFVTTEEAKESMQKMREQHRERRKQMRKERQKPDQ